MIHSSDKPQATLPASQRTLPIGSFHRVLRERGVLLQNSSLAIGLLVTVCVLFCSSLNGWSSPANHLVISEFMADNGTTLVDGDGEFVDWIEVYNPTALAVDLSGYSLTDDSADLSKWVFPSQSLPAGARVLVYASSKDGAAPVGQLHTNFKLGKSGEYLALVAPGGNSVLHAFSPVYPVQTNDISYGIISGDLTAVQYMGSPTPGLANDVTLPIAGPVVFSQASQTFTGSLNIEMASNQSGGAIYYTTDGSVPSTSNGTLYTSAISISSTTYVKAVTIVAGQTGVLSGQSYIRLAADVASYQSDLPLLVIENFGEGVIPAKGWNSTGAGIQQVARQSAAWATFGLDPGTGSASLSDTPQMISRLGIRGRGAFSSTWAQKPYSVETRDDEGEELDVEVLGMPQHSDWVLYYPGTGSIQDPSMMFNTFIYELSHNMGRYATKFRFVEAFINEDGGDLTLADRRGVYVILEKVSRGKDRLDFEKLSDDGNSGSWLVGINRLDSIPVGGFPTENGATSPQFFHTDGPNRISQTSPNASGSGDDIPRQGNANLNFDNPSGYKQNAAQRASIEGWFRDFEDVLYDDNQWLDPVSGYQAYLDRVDFVDYFMLNNLSRNGDGMLLSMFPWKGDDNKLRMGPAWDYNFGSYYMSNSNPTGSLWHRGDRLWYGRLFSDPDFQQLYIDRWSLHRDSVLSNAGIEAIVDGQAALIGETRAIRQGFADNASWTAELNKFKDFITDRADWYDSQFTAKPVYSVLSGDVVAGSTVSLTSSIGEIYYTTDGSDPRASGGGVASGALLYGSAGPIDALVSTGASVRVVIPTVSNPSILDDWTDLSFDDSTWMLGNTGVGYDRLTTYDSSINMDLQASMDGVNTSAYMRIDFNVADPSAYSSLLLKMKYDDGFAAYLNGVRVASGFAATNLSWSSAATSQRADSESLNFVDFDITAYLNQLVVGGNVLAIHGLNAGITSSDFLMVPEIHAGSGASGSAITLSQSTLITARVKNSAAWSAPAESYYFVDAVPASVANLVISEFNYRPADVSSSESSAGFSDRDDFEFIELMNVSGQTVNLSGVKFIRVNDQGITFDLSTVYPRTLEPGGRIQLVKDQLAFVERYGTSQSSSVLGEYSGNLGNDGELITLVDSMETTIRAFTYNDQNPWPELADGNGPSLVLVNPEEIPDHNVATNWRISAFANGSPGFSDSIPFAGGDIFNYALGSPLSFTSTSPQVFNVTYALNIGADDAAVDLESSTNLTDWSPYDPPAGLMSMYGSDGTMSYSGQIDTTGTEDRRFFRLKVTEE